MKPLKNYLKFLPSPQYIEEVLTEALKQLAESDPDACSWILCNSDYLEPDLDLFELAKNFVCTKLENQGFVVDQDFSFEPNRRLNVSENAKARLMFGNSNYECLLLEKILQIRD